MKRILCALDLLFTLAVVLLFLNNFGRQPATEPVYLIAEATVAGVLILAASSFTLVALKLLDDVG